MLYLANLETVLANDNLPNFFEPQKETHHIMTLNFKPILERQCHPYTSHMLESARWKNTTLF
jgi:hypothetical protein